MPDERLTSGSPGAEGGALVESGAPVEGAVPVDACPLPSGAGLVPQAAGGSEKGPARADASAGSEGGRLAVVIYAGVSFVAALVFWLVTTFVGTYPAVARYGGAAWVFVLFMIVLMPIVIPRVRNRRRRRQVECADGTCTIE